MSLYHKLMLTKLKIVTHRLSTRLPSSAHDGSHRVHKTIRVVVLEVESVVRRPVLLHQYQVAPVLLHLVAFQVAQVYAHGLHLHVPIVAANCATERIAEFTVTIVNFMISHRVVKKTLQKEACIDSHFLTKSTAQHIQQKNGLLCYKTRN